jgi:DNA end-binding protein Ku
MADRATWKGTLQIARVQIPIKVFPATESSASISFNQLHDAMRTDEGHTRERCHTRVQQKRWCATCVREVPTAEIVKGFEFETGRYVLVNDEEVAAIAPLSTKVIDLVQFADVSALPWLAIDRAYYLAPDGPDPGPAHEAYAIVCEAMAGQIGIGKLAIYGREYLVAVGPRDGALLLYTLHHAAEQRTAPYTTPDPRPVRGSFTLPPVAVTLAQRIILALSGPLDLAAFTDEYRDGVRQLIAAKIAGEEYVVPPPVDLPRVGTLHDALVQSLALVAGAKKTPAKATLPAKRKRA